MKEKNKEIATFKIAQELGGLELLDAKYEKQNFSRHSHEGYTIGVIEKGAQQFFRTGGNHIAPQNSIILVNADEVHNGHSATEGGWEYKAMYPVPEQFQTLGQELGSPNISLPYFPQPVVHDPELASQLRLVFETLEKSDNRLLRETLVYGTLIKLASKHSTHRAPLKESTKAQRQLQLVKEFLEDFPQTDVSLEELAKLAGLSPFHLLREFQKQFGFPPHAYQIQQRLRMAKKLLKQGQSISDVAQECGFHDQSHLHRHFKKAMGVTPGQYLRFS
ncbi:AraC family transcriptional regulator [Vibrio parahaemolyticus]|uniref:AraC family transcriptional regulator n=1 Tax=Vibrio parahaemolyticus TaxID=670 RepID=A0AAW8PWV3_VIBPH|nr:MULTISPECIES: AraC family transcriptional regulator [Vibrio]MBE3696608.1 AraC family transcriptional regulator [Vibrio parahaemolyticus]MBE3775745.1 AraC family transcriptional regulator [Vibrio parahaemolyticus]MCZ5865797.1 AraC family transcriptional regulator [Vibrio parahaemolyticus]MCZ5897004.1 AraC family transcriptional regulator [Vibrio parahaemolyticus]MCZ6019761.1 AraC family transcriptional regulator [Vibrio parahaemolyticus]